MASACMNIPGDRSSISSWISWHKNLKKCVGKSYANELFLMAWDREGLDHTIELRGYMAKNGVDMDKSALNRVTDFGVGTLNFFGGMIDFSSYMAMGVAIIVIGGLGMMVFNITSTKEGSTRLAAGIATRGMSEGMGAAGGAKGIKGGTKGISGGMPKQLPGK